MKSFFHQIFRNVNQAKKLLIAGILLVSYVTVNAQQDPMFTKYMFNSLWYNPAYAGSSDHMNFNLIHRSQWIGFPGAPQTQSLTLHTPLRNERVGVGFSLVNDKVGALNNLYANFAYAYRIPVGYGNLSIGMQGGLSNFTANWAKLNIKDPDPSFQTPLNTFRPNFGAGLYYYTSRFYAGLGVPHLIEYDLSPKTAQDAIYARQYRHYYFSMGGAINLSGPDLVFKPSILVKNVGLLSGISKDTAFQRINAPTEIDIDASFLFFPTLWIGAAYRTALQIKNSSNDSFDLWAAYFLGNGLRIGLAYDYPLTRLRQQTIGSFEIMLGYEFDYKTSRVVTPRYF